MAVVLVVAAWVAGTVSLARMDGGNRLAIAAPAACDRQTQVVCGPSDWQNVGSAGEAGP